MHPGTQRVITFLILCSGFGAAVWISKIGDLNSTAQLAQSLLAQTSVVQSGKEDVNEKCVPGRRIEHIFDENGNLIDKNVTVLYTYKWGLIKTVDESRCQQKVQFGEASCEVTYGCLNGNCFCLVGKPLG